jgi:hypothetical protein
MKKFNQLSRDEMKNVKGRGGDPPKCYNIPVQCLVYTPDGSESGYCNGNTSSCTCLTTSGYYDDPACAVGA